MDSQEAEQRKSIVEEARRWIGTNYRKGAMIRGVGCDCATLLVGVLQACQLMTKEQVGYFSHDWWAHAEEETYLLRLMRHASKVAETVCRLSTATEPGNLALTKVANSKVFNHGGIITSWPLGVHAVKVGVMEVDFSRDPMWAGREIVIFDPLAKDLNHMAKENYQVSFSPLK